MKIEIHVHNHNRNEECESQVLHELRDLRREIMAKLEDFEAALKAVDDETTRIGNLIQELTEQLNRTDLTAEQEAEILAKLSAAGERLKGVGTSVEEPVPPPDIPV